MLNLKAGQRVFLFFYIFILLKKFFLFLINKGGRGGRAEACWDSLLCLLSVVKCNIIDCFGFFSEILVCSNLVPSTIIKSTIAGYPINTMGTQFGLPQMMSSLVATTTLRFLAKKYAIH